MLSIAGTEENVVLCHLLAELKLDFGELLFLVVEEVDKLSHTARLAPDGCLTLVGLTG